MIDDFEDGWVTAFNIAEMKFDRNSPEKMIRFLRSIMKI